MFLYHLLKIDPSAGRSPVDPKLQAKAERKKRRHDFFSNPFNKSFKSRQSGTIDGEGLAAKKDNLDLFRASLTSAANRLLLSRDVDQVNPYAVDPTLPVLPVRGLPQSVRAGYQQQLAAQKRDATRARSSDPTLNLIARQVAAQQERSALDELASREASLVLQDKQRVAQEAARNKQLQTSYKVRADEFKNQLNKLSAQGQA